MKKTLVFVALLAAIVAVPLAKANGPWQRMFQDIKTPSQAQLEHFSWLTPEAGNTVKLSTSAQANTSASTTISSFSAQPDFPRNIVITPSGNTTYVAAGTAVVSGLNIFGKSISENFSISFQQNTATTGSKAFKSVSSVLFPATSGPNVRIAIGEGVKLGINRCMDRAGDYLSSEFNNAYDSTRGTMAINASSVESNTFQSNSSLNGSRVDLYYVENFQCYGN